jgi:hypothetical protein
MNQLLDFYKTSQLLIMLRHMLASSSLGGRGPQWIDNLTMPGQRWDVNTGTAVRFLRCNKAGAQ